MTSPHDQLWAATFRHAAERSPFYRERFGRLTQVPRLEELPTVDKRTVSERNLDFLCVPREQIVEIVTTSGTTGQPLLWMLTEADLSRLAAGAVRVRRGREARAARARAGRFIALAFGGGVLTAPGAPACWWRPYRQCSDGPPAVSNTAGRRAPGLP